MGIEYPGGIDSFNVPSEPESVPLSEAGSSSRNHVELHLDTAEAVIALETNAAFKTHDHSGDGTTQHGNKLVQANTHQSPDTDASLVALHHTLGTMPFQAATGNHHHDYESSTIENKPLILCTSTTRPSSPQLGLHIWETDTNRWRCWSQFGQSNVAHAAGVYYTDNFERTSSTSLGNDWEQTYFSLNPTLSPDGKAGGVLAIPDGQNAQWVFNYTAYLGSGGKIPSWPPPDWDWPYIQGRCLARNVDVVAQHTLTDNQSLSWTAGELTIPFRSKWPPTPSANDFYLRLSDDRTSYIRVSYTYTPSKMFWEWKVTNEIEVIPAPGSMSIMVYSTTSGIDGERLLGQLPVTNVDPWSTYQIDIVAKTLTFYIDSEFVGTVKDTGQVSRMGSSNRGWGFGMTVARDSSWTTTQTAHPTYVHSISMRDIVFYTGSPIWQLLPMGSLPIVRLRQGTKQLLDHAGSLVRWDVEDEDNFGMFNINNSVTDIVISESGLYHLVASVQWGTHYYPDAGTIVLMLNGHETPIRQQISAYGQTVQATMGVGGKGSGSKNPTYSLTVPLQGKLRCAAGDILQLQTYYTSPNSIHALMETYANPAANVMSRFELHFVAP